MIRLTLGLALATTLGLAGGTALALEDPAAEETAAGAHATARENHTFVGAKGAYLAVPEDGEIHHHLGGGVFFELTLAPQALALEISAKWMSAAAGYELPLDIMLKVPFHVSRVLHPYLGAGFVAVLAVDDGVAAHFGGGVIGGSQFWLTDQVGLLAELCFNLLYGHGLIREFGGALGVVFGW
jgi:hypothetical protein